MALPVTIDPERVSGEPCFTGTRVPTHILWDYLLQGETLDAFLEAYPGVTRQQVSQLINLFQANIRQFAHVPDAGRATAGEAS